MDKNDIWFYFSDTCVWLLFQFGLAASGVTLEHLSVLLVIIYVKIEWWGYFMNCHVLNFFGNEIF